MKQGHAVGGDETVMRRTPRTSGLHSRVWALAGAAAGTMLVGSLIMPATVAAEDEVVVEASVTAPSVAASANCSGVDSWVATWVVSSNAGDGGSWQMNGGTFQSTASNFVIEETYSLDVASSGFSATVSYDGGAQARPVASSADRPSACISAPPPPAPDVETEAVSQLTNNGETDSAVPEPSAESAPTVAVFAPAAVASPSAVASPAPDLAQTLPATGNETTILALLALASLGAGLLLVGASRRSTATEL